MNRRLFIAAMAFLAEGFGGLRALFAAEPKPDGPTPLAPDKGKPNVATPTFGGKQFWTDELLFDQWRIQRNVYTGKYRLLDASDVRQAWGTLAECREKLERIKRDKSLPEMRGRVVIVLHGLGRSRSSTHGLAKYLADQGQLTTMEFGYASTRADVAEHAKSLACVVEHLPGVEEIDFVAHSLGNVVVRRYLADATDETQNRHPDSRIKRIVMLAPPNNGAKLAQLLGDNKVVKTIAGTPIVELGSGWPELQQHLATPACEFGIIAGGRGEEKSRNPLLDGDDDLIVGVPETRLAGASDFLVVPALHTFIMDEPKVREATLEFLLHGYFVSEAKRQRIQGDSDDK